MPKATDLDVSKLEQVDIPTATDALAIANAQAKARPADTPTDLTDAKEVTDVGGTILVRW